MKQKYCYVIDKTGKPLAPTKKWDMVYRKLKNGTAKIVRKKPFTIQFLDKEVKEEEIIKCTLCLDPGKTTGIAVIKSNTKEVVFLAEFEINSHKIAEKLERRRNFRRLRKSYQRKKRIRRAKKCGTIFEGEREFKFPKMKSGIKCKYIRPKSPRYLNRKKKHKYAPTVQHFLQSILRIIRDIRKFIAIDKIKVEFVPFDIRKLQEPWIKGFWYQISNKGKFSCWAEYVKYRDSYKCVKCGSDDNLEVHHILPRSKGGRDNPRNMVTLCRNCHQEIHRDQKLFNKWKKKFESYINKHEKKRIKDENLKYASYMNQIIKDLVLHLDIPVEFVSPQTTVQNRAKLNIDKTHYNDAIAIYSDNVIIDKELKVFRIIQLNRHPLRLVTQGIDDRMYCFRPKTKKSKPIAFNRKSRTAQEKPSIIDLVKEYGKEITGKLCVYRKGGPRYRIQNQPYKPGDVILFNDNGQIRAGIVNIVRNKLKKIKLYNYNKEISFKNVIKCIGRYLCIYH